MTESATRNSAFVIDWQLGKAGIMKALFGPMGAILATAGLMVLSTAAEAQSTSGSASNSNSSSGRMWGAAGSAGTALDSSNMHSLDGNSAAQVIAAKQGLLIGGTGMSITAIGSQSIVSTTVIGNGNSTTVSATQTSSNTGTVSNNGTIGTNTP